MGSPSWVHGLEPLVHGLWVGEPRLWLVDVLRGLLLLQHERVQHGHGCHSGHSGSLSSVACGAVVPSTSSTTSRGFQSLSLPRRPLVVRVPWAGRSCRVPASPGDPLEVFVSDRGGVPRQWDLRGGGQSSSLSADVTMRTRTGTACTLRTLARLATSLPTSKVKPLLFF